MEKEIEEVEITEETQTTLPKGLKEKKFSWGKLRRYYSLDIEAGAISNRQCRRGSQAFSWLTILQLAFQSIGIVYGDIGTSPLYVYPSTFSNVIKETDDILGVLSITYYTLIFIPLIKYVFIVLHANDNGNGGTFAMYSKICRCAKVSLLPSQQVEDKELSNYRLEVPNNRQLLASKVKSTLENTQFAKHLLLLITMLGTCMVIGDGVITPCISVLSAVIGIREATSFMTEDRIVWISVAILIFLFLVQRFGTEKVGYSFAPILTIWFIFIAGIGAFNFFKHDPSVVKAFYPKYIIDYFKRNRKDAWISLGGIILCTTGAEALFADVGHFTVLSIQISTCCVVFPSVMLAYTGQAAYLRKHPSDGPSAFYKSIPGPLYWPMFVVAVMAAIIASQSLISGAFSIIQQSLSLGCFPRVKVVHTSPKYEGQVYIPEINYMLMLACIGLTLGFRDPVKIGNAYGIAVVCVMSLTSALLILIMLMIWKTPIILILAYAFTIYSVELVYLSSVLYKFKQGGYLPLAFAAILLVVMYVWNYVFRKKYTYELDNKISPDKLKEIVANVNLHRVPGIAFFYSGLVQGIPPIFKHYVDNVPSLHSILIFVSIKSLPISRVLPEERFLFRRINHCGQPVFRCVVRYGYTDLHGHEFFERTLVDQLKEFIKEELIACHGKDMPEKGDSAHDGETINEKAREERVDRKEAIQNELELLEREYNAGIVHLLGETEVLASQGSSFGRRVLINYAYNFLSRNVRQRNEVLNIPHKRLLKVGMTYEL